MSDEYLPSAVYISKPRAKCLNRENFRKIEHFARLGLNTVQKRTFAFDTSAENRTPMMSDFDSFFNPLKFRDLIMQMACISESKFAEICSGIHNDRETIIKHNPIGTDEEILLWMLLSCLISYLSLSDQEAPCFTGRPDSKTYRDAIIFVLKGRTDTNFDPDTYIDEMLAK